MDIKNNVNVQTIRWKYLLVGTVSMLFAGIIYAWSILKAPLATSFGWNSSDLAINFTVTMCFFCIGGIAAGYLTNRTSPNVSVIVGAVLACSGLIITSRMSGDNIITLYIAYGGMSGFGIGMTYNSIISTISAWFPDKRGVCSGALMMGFGFSTLMLGNIAGAMISIESIGWRGTYFVLGVVIGLILLLTGLVIRLPSVDMQFPQPKTSKKKKLNGNFVPRDYTPGEMVRRFSFWRFFFFCIAISALGNTVISFARDFVMSVGAAATLATTLVGVLSVCNGLGRILAGILFDALGRRRTMLISSTITILAASVTLCAVLLHCLAIGIIGLCLTGISYGCGPTITTSFTGNFYGNKYFAMNLSIAFLMMIPTSFTATLSGMLVNITGSYVMPCVMLLALSVIALFLCLSIKHP